MAVTKVVIGTVIVTECTFSIDDVELDPTTVNLEVRKPDGTITTYTYGGVGSPVVKESQGNYNAEININQEGYWSIRWEGVGVVDIAYEVEVLCQDSQFTTV